MNKNEITFVLPNGTKVSGFDSEAQAMRLFNVVARLDKSGYLAVPADKPSVSSLEGAKGTIKAITTTQDPEKIRRLSNKLTWTEEEHEFLAVNIEKGEKTAFFNNSFLKKRHSQKAIASRLFFFRNPDNYKYTPKPVQRFINKRKSQAQNFGSTNTQPEEIKDNFFSLK